MKQMLRNDKVGVSLPRQTTKGLSSQDQRVRQYASYMAWRWPFNLGGSHERTAEWRRQISGTTDQSLRLCLLGVGSAGGPRIRQGPDTPLRTLRWGRQGLG